jgi:hypothetical protein
MSKIKDLSLEELLDLAEKGIEGELDHTNLSDNSSVSRYIRDRKIQAGEDLVPTYVIYQDYCKNWAPWSKTKVSKIDFFRKFNKNFTQHRKTKQRYYLLDGELFDLTEENKERAKEYVKRREAQTVTKVKKEKSSDRQDIQPEEKI